MCRAVFFFFNDTATTEIYTLSLHDALPIWSQSRASGRTSLIAAPARLRPPPRRLPRRSACGNRAAYVRRASPRPPVDRRRSEEHTSELQSPCNLVCRLLLEKKNSQ